MERLAQASHDSVWNELVHELFGWQFARVAPFRRLCEAQGINPRTLSHWQEIPAMPQQAFKETRLFAHEELPPEIVFQTSGTTTGHPGRQHLLKPDIYRFATLGPPATELLRGTTHLFCLAPSPSEVPASSLSAMFGFWAEFLQQDLSHIFYVKAGQLDEARLSADLARLSRLAKKGQTPARVALVGTAFSFVHLLDSSFSPDPLPSGSWVLETGGFKGRSREVPKAELYRSLAARLQIEENQIWNEYGMSELSSQAYARGVAGEHHLPPWARVLLVDPSSPHGHAPVAPGKPGLVRWFDLANVDSVFALQTLDQAVSGRDEGTFHLQGRLPRTSPRGCSLSAEDLAVNDSAPKPPSSGPAWQSSSGVSSPLPLSGSPLRTPWAGATHHHCVKGSTRRRVHLLARFLAEENWPGLLPGSFLPQTISSATAETILLQFLSAELRHADVLEEWIELPAPTPSTGSPSTPSSKFIRALAPNLIIHFCAGNLPISAQTSLIFGLLLGSKNLLKLPSSRDDGLTRDEIIGFANRMPPELRGLIDFADALDPIEMAQAELVIAFGSDATMKNLLGQLEWRQRIILHGHAVSLVWLEESARDLTILASRIAQDLLAYDQLGCLSPQALYVSQAADLVSLAPFLASALEEKTRNFSPRRSVTACAAIREARDLAFALGHQVWLPVDGSQKWTLIHDPDPYFKPSPLHGVLPMRVARPEELKSSLAPLAGRISTVACLNTLCGEEAEKTFLNLGVTRFCPPGALQRPPLSWHPDGRLPLADWVRWLTKDEAQG